MIRIGGSGPWTRCAALALSVVLASATAACTSGSGAGAGKTTASGPPGSLSAPFTMSYAGAAVRLSGMTAEDAADQVRDWVRIGVAARLGLNSRQLRDATYDSLPVRDAGFADLSRQVSGPGRVLYDARGVLHLLVPDDDAHASRTIGLLLDQYRTDTGADPKSVQIDRYLIQTGSRSVLVTPGSVTPVAKARADNGYVTAKIITVQDLKSFLSRSTSLSQLQVRDSQVWASGWKWSVPAGARVDADDVSVLQRGYSSDSGPRPAFSLDPPDRATGSRTTVQDLRAVAPQLSPALANAMVNNTWPSGRFASEEEFREAVSWALFDGTGRSRLPGLPSDRAQLWAIDGALEGRPVFSQARYDGGLAGTEVGMTLFYADHVAKNWTAGVGKGVPARAVPGFVPDPDAVTPWSQCAGGSGDKSEHGRLWFGQNDAAFRMSTTAVSLGAQPTRLFARSDGAHGTEVEPSFAFGRGLRWWDEHFQAVADYEPQYQRLDQIMRWSGALDWLSTSAAVRLPQVSRAEIATGLKFKDWYAQHGELRERAPVRFVTPPSATQEAVAALPSRAFTNCGSLWISGGVSLGNRSERLAHQGYSHEPTLPEQVSRAGVHDGASAVDPATGSGRIIELQIDDSGAVADRLTRVLGSAADGHQTVQVTGQGRRVSPLGALKIWRSESVTRRLTLDVDARGGRVSERVTLQGHDLGRVTASSSPDGVSVRWSPGPVDRARTVLESLQARLKAHPGATPPVATRGMLYAYRGPGNRILYRVGESRQWLEISSQLPPPGDGLVLRLGVPGAKPGDGPRFFAGTFPGSTDLPPPLSGGGSEGGAGGGPWMSVTRPGPRTPAQIMFLPSQGKVRRTVQVRTPEGRSSTLSIGEDGRPQAPAGDPLLGVAGPDIFAALERGFPEVEKALDAPAAAGSDTFRVVSLEDDGYALARPGEDIILVEPGHSWAQVVDRVKEQAQQGEGPLVRILDGRPFVVSTRPLTATGQARTVRLEELIADPQADIYLSEQFRSTFAFADGPPITSALPRDTLVGVQEHLGHTGPQPDILSHHGADWFRIGPITRTGSGASSSPTSPSSTSPSPSGAVVAGPSPTGPSPTSPSSTSSTSPSPSGAVVAGPNVVLLVCPADAPASGCPTT